GHPSRPPAVKSAVKSAGKSAGKSGGKSGGYARGKLGGRPSVASRRYLVPGERAVVELLGARPGAIKEVWMEEGREFPELDGPLGRLGLRVQRVPREALDDMVGEG